MWAIVPARPHCLQLDSLQGMKGRLQDGQLRFSKFMLYQNSMTHSCPQHGSVGVLQHALEVVLDHRGSLIKAFRLADHNYVSDMIPDELQELPPTG